MSRLPPGSSTVLARNGWDVPAGFSFELEGRRFDVTDWLRVLPGRRLVGRCAGGVIAKLFVGRRASGDCTRERQHLDNLRAACAPVPATLACGSLEDGVWALLLEEIVSTRPATVEDLVRALAHLHNAGFLQHDPHPGNFIVRDEVCVLIDAAGIRPAARTFSGGRKPAAPPDAACLENLGRLLAGMPALDGNAVTDMYTLYRRTRATDVADDVRLQRAVDNSRRRLVDARVRKGDRNCSDYRQVSAATAAGVVRRDAGWLAPLLDDPEGVFALGAPVKTGNTASVVRVELEGQLFALKRYAPKSTVHRLRQSLRTSRARRAWRSAQRLLQLQIPTAQPLAVLETRGVLAGVNWFAARWLDGEPLTTAAASMDAATLADCAAQLAEMWRRLHAVGLVHGDAKGTNYLWCGGCLHLIDLDAMRASKRGRDRDRQRLLANFDNTPAVREVFERALTGLAR